MSNEQLRNLIKMANQISANNLHHETERAASKAVANHISMFWARSMKNLIIEYANADGSELSKLSRKAIAQIEMKVDIA